MSAKKGMGIIPFVFGEGKEGDVQSVIGNNGL
jgi:hypothetical protein